MLEHVNDGDVSTYIASRNLTQNEYNYVEIDLQGSFTVKRVIIKTNYADDIVGATLKLYFPNTAKDIYAEVGQITGQDIYFRISALASQDLTSAQFSSGSKVSNIYTLTSFSK